MTQAPEELEGPELVRYLTEKFDTITSVVTLSDAELDILHPRDADDLISEADFVRDERLPYWADLWPSSLILAELLVSADGNGISLLELGCGCGVVSTSCTKAGFSVVATDYYPDALLFARANTWQNTGSILVTRHLDWRAIPSDLGIYDIVVASDVLYEPDYPALVAEVLARTLKPRGFALIADPGRDNAPRLAEECAKRGLNHARDARLPFSAGAQKQTIDVYRVTRMTHTPPPERP